MGSSSWLGPCLFLQLYFLLFSIHIYCHRHTQILALPNTLTNTCVQCLKCPSLSFSWSIFCYYRQNNHEYPCIAYTSLYRYLCDRFRAMQLLDWKIRALKFVIHIARLPSNVVVPVCSPPVKYESSCSLSRLGDELVCNALLELFCPELNPLFLCDQWP